MALWADIYHLAALALMCPLFSCGEISSTIGAECDYCFRGPRERRQIPDARRLYECPSGRVTPQGPLDAGHPVECQYGGPFLRPRWIFILEDLYIAWTPCSLATTTDPNLAADRGALLDALFGPCGELVPGSHEPYAVPGG
ncbi:hypothetical protein CGRA01v4_00793 [Colletotrichum graminicola]|nr:hypothetical protein CGRA01v4_00793 [Colletotrichum graminicola]